jgi:hypothetical protein
LEIVPGQPFAAVKTLADRKGWTPNGEAAYCRIKIPAERGQSVLFGLIRFFGVKNREKPKRMAVLPSRISVFPAFFRFFPVF